MDMLRQGAEWLSAQRQQHVATDVQYHRFGGGTSSVKATLGKTVFRAENEFGVTVRVHSFDFIISSMELGFEPQRNDEIICDGKTYEVLAPNGEPCWRWSGTSNNTYRIHTKEIGDGGEQ